MDSITEAMNASSGAASRGPHGQSDAPPTHATQTSATQTDADSQAHEAFRAFYTAEFPPLVVLAQTITSDRGAAEELVQEAMVRAADEWPRVRGLDKPGAWVRRVTINLALNERRSRSRERGATSRLETLGTYSTPAHEVADPAVWSAVATLTPRQRAAVALRYLEDLPVSEIADLMGCSVSATTSHLHTARTRLATLLGDQS